jgi:hypothetical protein
MHFGVPNEWLNIFLLAGILVTAIFTIFKAGRWFGGVETMINNLSLSLKRLKSSFDDHTKVEMERFDNIAKAHEQQNKEIEKVKKMCEP